MIEVQDLHVVFGEGEMQHRAVDGVSFSVREGESFGLVGESGCGKSTVLRTIAGLVTPAAGTIRMAGEPVPKSRPKSFFRRVQMVFQDPYGSLHPRQTVHAQLIEPLRIHRLDRPEARVQEALQAVGLGPAFRWRFPHQLSGGQRQRVAIARALVLEPEVMLLDEPTSALDVSVQAEILNLLSDLRAARGLTYLLVSHDPAVIAHMCERLAVMNAGRIVETVGSRALATGDVQDPYTKRLLQASEAYGEEASTVTSEARLPVDAAQPLVPSTPI